MKFVEGMESTPENITKFVKDNTKGIKSFFDKDPNLSVKSIDSEELYKKSFNTLKHHLNKGARKIFHNLDKPRLIDIAEYDPNAMAYEFNETDDISRQFDGAKLHWLVNDIKISGLGYPPQGYMQKDGFVPHPGTYRFFAAFAQQLPTKVSVWDTYNEFNSPPLKLIDWINFCSNGFIRKNRYITLKLDDVDDMNRETSNRYLEIHETKNHHDHNIFNQDRALAEIYNKTKPTIFCATTKIADDIRSICLDPRDYNFSITSENPFLIPSSCNFKGVAMYIGEEGLLHTPFELLFLYLDINDDIAYIPDTKLMIFNNSSHNCKKLIPEIVNESSNKYLEDFKWASKTSIIPREIGMSL